MSEGEGSRTVVNWKLKVDDCKLILESLEVFGRVYGELEVEILVKLKKQLAASSLIGL